MILFVMRFSLKNKSWISFKLYNIQRKNVNRTNNWENFSTHNTENLLNFKPFKFINKYIWSCVSQYNFLNNLNSIKDCIWMTNLQWIILWVCYKYIYICTKFLSPYFLLNCSPHRQIYIYSECTRNRIYHRTIKTSQILSNIILIKHIFMHDLYLVLSFVFFI